MPVLIDRPRKLGRGLASLLGQSDGPEDSLESSDNFHAEPPTAPSADAILHVAPDSIRPNPFQPRTDFDETGLAEMAESIKTCGILSPLLVRRAPDGSFELIAGERRLRAAKRAGLDKVPVHVRKVTDSEALEQALVENLQRRDLNPIEKAVSLAEYLRMHGLSQTEAEKRLGMSRSELANHIRLLKLAPAVQEMARRGILSYGHARALLGVDNPLKQKELAETAVAQQWSVRQIEEHLKAAAEAKPEAVEPKPAKAAPAGDPQIRELEDEFTRSLGVKVNIKPGRKANCGVITIPYAGLDDFDRIRAALTGNTVTP